MAKSDIEVDVKVMYLEMHMQTLSLRPGDVVVITSEAYLSLETVARIKADWAKFVDAGHKVIVLGGGLKVGVLREEDKASLRG